MPGMRPRSNSTDDPAKRMSKESNEICSISIALRTELDCEYWYCKQPIATESLGGTGSSTGRSEWKSDYVELQVSACSSLPSGFLSHRDACGKQAAHSPKTSHSAAAQVRSDTSFELIRARLDASIAALPACHRQVCIPQPGLPEERKVRYAVHHTVE